MNYIDELKAIHSLSSYPCATEHALTGIHLGLAVQEVDDLRTEVERLKLSVRERRKLDGSFAKQHKEAMDELRADLAALTAERDEARKDSDRLDWLDNRITSQEQVDLTGPKTRDMSIRAAIDAARATPTGGAGENAGARREET